MYPRLAELSPHGKGSILLLEDCCRDGAARSFEQRDAA